MPPVPQRPVQPADTPAEAIAKGYFAQVRFLLELGGGADSRHAATGRTPLILCAMVREPDWAVSLAHLLLEKGARVGLKDRRGLNALHYACAFGRDQLSGLYLQAIDYRVNDTDAYKNTAMHYAVRSGHHCIVESLLMVLRRFQLPVSLPNREGVTPLMLAYLGGHLGIAQTLLTAGADASAVDAFGKATPVYEREALERRQVDADATEAKAAGRRLRFDDIDGWRRYQTRLRSAPVGGRSGVGRTFKEEQRELRRVRMYQPEEADLISAASPLDRRNDPKEVFQATPVDFFGPAPQQHPSQLHQHRRQLLSISGVGFGRQAGASAPQRRARSALPLGRGRRRRDEEAEAAADDSGDSDRSKDSREIKLLTAVGCKAGTVGGGSVRMMASMFHNYEYHCSPLYRPPVKAPDPALYVHDFASRFLTPPQADQDATGSDSTPIGRRRKELARKGKRGSTSAAEAAKKKAGGGGGGSGGGSGGGGGRVSRAAFGRDDQ